jgi:predicted alpha-1,2-mannosidase
MKHRTIITIIAAFIFNAAFAENYTQYVDPTIGTGGHGHVFLGADVPFGYVQLGPTEVVHGWDWCSGYNASDSIIVGFSHTHLSGTGVGDLGDIQFMPVINARRQWSHFSHNDEVCRPGYYSVLLRDSHISVALTATQRVGFHRYVYPHGGTAHRLVVNVRDGIGWDRFVDGRVRMINDSVIEGFRVSSGWARHQPVHFVAVFSSKIKSFIDADSVYLLTFSSDTVMAKVALSPVSTRNARLNMEAEMPSWNFDAIAANADDAWNCELSRIAITARDASVKRVFYTSFYHTMIAPSVFCDVNGDYFGSDGSVHNDKTFINMTTFSLWDTYRSLHPLMTLVQKDKLRDIAQTFLHIYNEQGELPVWHLMGNETYCMVGCPAVPVLADMVLKDVDVNGVQAYQAIRKTLLGEGRGLGYMNSFGFLPYDMAGNETVSRCLEYAIAFWSAAQVAQRLAHDSDYDYFMERAMSYKKYFDTSTGFMRPVDVHGNFRNPFSPFAVTKDYTEGNSWQYTFLVPHDVHGLISLFGGERRFLNKLDSLFVATGSLGSSAPPDITGLIGQYAQGNEPSHHVLYMYSYAGAPYKAAPLLRKIMKDMYTTSRDGLIGNEDVGQMSAWYILSSIGLYQVEPCGGRFIIGSPIIDSAELNVGNGRTFHIIVRNNSPRNIYVDKVLLNGAHYDKSYISYSDIMRGGTLTLTMSSRPTAFGTSLSSRP